MIRIAITPAAFDAIVRSLPLGSVAYEPEVNAKGEREIWLAPRAMGLLTPGRRPSESYSIIRPAGMEEI
jgi:hypothetical protein